MALDLGRANPAGTAPGELALDHELADIWHELLVMAPHHDFEVVTAHAATVDDLMRLLMNLNPTVLHLAGHGVAGGRGAPATSAGCRDVEPAGKDRSGILLLDQFGNPQPVPARAMAQMVTSTAPDVRLLLLNACYSEAQGEVLSGAVDYVITMNGAIRDDSARSFAAAFYRGLGHHESVAVAFSQAKAALAGKGCPDADLPTLHTRGSGDLVLAPRSGGFSVQPRSAEPDSGKLRQVARRHQRCGALVGLALAVVAMAAAAYLRELLQGGPQPGAAPDQSTLTAPAPSANHAPPEDAVPPSPAPPHPPRLPHPPHRPPPGHLTTLNPAPHPQPGREARSSPRGAPPPALGAADAPVPAPQDTPVPRAPEASLSAWRSSPRPAQRAAAFAKPVEPVAAPAKPVESDAPPAKPVEPDVAPAKPARPDDTGAPGELDREIVRRYIFRHHDSIRHCYEQRRMARPDLTGKVLAQFDITPGGSVASASAIGLDSAVDSCVADAIKGIGFPRSSTSVHVSYLFDFRPVDAPDAPCPTTAAGSCPARP